MTKHALTCLAYNNYQPPYYECSCGAENAEHNVEMPNSPPDFEDTDEGRLSAVFGEIAAERTRALDNGNDVYNSLHEGFAVLLEEVDELWDEVKKNPRKHPERVALARAEAIQVATAAVRIVLELT